MTNLIVSLVMFVVLLTASAQEQSGRATFVSRCAGCHGTDGNGGELGPAITNRVLMRGDQDLMAVIRDGIPAAGMPSFAMLTPSESSDLVRYLRTMQPRNGPPPPRVSVTINGRALAGIALNQTRSDMQVLGDDGKIHLWRKTDGGYRAVTSQADWLSYNGATSGSRYSTLAQIDRSNIARMVPKWMFSLQNTPRLQVTPVVV